MSHRTWGKPDANQAAIVKALRKAGCVVQLLSAVGGGCPDLLVCDSCTGRLLLMEVKMPGKELTQRETDWIFEWPGHVAIVHSVEEALDAARGTR